MRKNHFGIDLLEVVNKHYNTVFQGGIYPTFIARPLQIGVKDKDGSKAPVGRG